jgi:hypothetical protein
VQRGGGAIVTTAAAKWQIIADKLRAGVTIADISHQLVVSECLVFGDLA